MHRRLSWWVPVVASFAAVRLWLLLVPLGLIAYPQGADTVNDLHYYADWAATLAGGTFPVGDAMWQYPPLAGAVFALGAALGPHPVFGLMALFLVCDAAVLVGLIRRGGRRAAARGGAWAWVAAGAVIGPVFLARFDVVPAAVVALALMTSTAGGRGALIAVGALLKVWPVLVLPALPRPQWPRATVAAVVTSLTTLAALAGWARGGLQFLTAQGDRGLQIESLLAWPFLVALHGQHRTGAADGPLRIEYRYGALEVVGPGVQSVATACTVASVVALGWYVWARVRGRWNGSPAELTLVAVLLMLVTSRVLSPQYSVWVAAIAAVCLTEGATSLRPAIAWAAASAVLAQYLYPGHYADLLVPTPAALVVQGLRLACLVVATTLAVRAVSAGRAAQPAPDLPAAAVRRSAR